MAATATGVPSDPVTARPPTTGRPTRGRTLPSVGDRRGLTGTGAVAVALLLGLAGGAFDVLTGSGLREVFAVSFVLGCLVAALTVHREDLVAAVVMPPLVFVVLAIVAGAVEPTMGNGSFLTQQAIELANALVLGAPVLVAATALALLVALLRYFGGRR